jgi:hypothetical protein
MKRVMKKLLALTLLAGCGFQPANEEPVVDSGTPETRIVEVVTTVLPHGQWTKTSTVKDVTTPISLELNDTSVFCTSLGYGGENFLKVSIPQLDALAHFDHRVEGTNLPCAAVGLCSAQMNADNILQSNPGLEPVDLRVLLTEKLFLDGDAETCQRQLIEDVSTTVRGVPLKHHVEGELETLTLADCTGR